MDNAAFDNFAGSGVVTAMSRARIRTLLWVHRNYRLYCVSVIGLGVVVGIIAHFA